MTTRRSLLSFLSRRLTNQTEDIAVEALGYILSSSEASRQALLDSLRSSGADIDSLTRIQTQSTGAGGERPDLSGLDEHGQERLLIEAKFWAGLTGNQPVTYLRRLSVDRSSVFLVVAPALRLETLWAELRRRISEAGDFAITNERVDSEARWADAGDNRKLILTSWRNLLGGLETSANSAGDIQTVNDIHQLQGLAEQEDTDAFLPLRPEQLSPEFPRLLPHLNRLVDNAAERIKQDGLASWVGPINARRYYAGHAMTFCDVRNVSIGIYYGAWRTRHLSPIWLALPIKDPGVFRVLDTLRQESFQGHVSRQYCYIPVRLELGVEYDAVLDGMVQQLNNIAQILKP